MDHGFTVYNLYGTFYRSTHRGIFATSSPCSQHCKKIDSGVLRNSTLENTLLGPGLRPGLFIFQL
jgi:hypothetical protein